MFTLPTFQGQVVFALITSEGAVSAREGADAELRAADDDAGQAITVAGNPMGSDAGHLVAAGDEVRDEFRRRAFPSAENNAEEVVGEPFRITEVLHGVFG